MRNTIFLSVLILGILLPVYAKKDKFELKLDYSGKENWTYTIFYQSKCIFEKNKEKTPKETEITCDLNGTLSDNKERLSFAVNDVSVKSELYDEEVQNKIKENLSESTMDLALVEGAPEIDTVPDFSSEGIPEWNVYMQFSKLLPEMPKQAVKKGFTWERSVTLPIKTAQGTNICEVYRLYKVEEISPKKDTVLISWQFKYATIEKDEEAKSLTQYIPIGGKGTGTAVIDIANKVIKKASIDFQTPVATVEGSTVTWKENTEIELQEK
ncbi:MAG: hypothetical protein GF401_15175 [Chitinivibrionales bacterium]|nr:hypothetical protein [Chitinivibrionales bacterium]